MPEIKLVKLLGFPEESPYGNPIPGLADLGLEEVQPGPAISLGDILTEGATIRATVRRLAEPAQVEPEMLRDLASAGVFPGSELIFEATTGWVKIGPALDEVSLEIPTEFASFIFVDPQSTRL